MPLPTAEQSRLCAELLQRLFDAVRAAPTLPRMLEALALHAEPLETLGLHDEAARLRAFTRAVVADVARFEREAALEPLNDPNRGTL